MISNLKLTNFRKVRDDEMTFTPGINVLRGVNEASKSTRIEAMSYALFGSKSLRTPLDQCVTWGEPANSLKVVLTMVIGGDTFTFSRSKGGAEVLKNGTVFSTGQNEVSALAATLLGADCNTAGKLMFSNQNALRGILDGDPKEISLFLEDLAGMGQFDTILENAQSRLALGSPSLLEERLKGAEATLDAALSNRPPLPNSNEHNDAVNALKATIDKNTAAVPDLEIKATTAEYDWRAGSELYMKRINLEAALGKADDALVAAKKQADALSHFGTMEVSTDIHAIKGELATALNFEKHTVAYGVFTGLPKGRRWVGTASDFDREYTTCAAAKDTYTKEVNRLTLLISKAENRRINHDKCDKCKQDVTHLAHVVETNAAVDAELAELRQQNENVVDKFVAESKSLLIFEEINDFSQLVSRALPKLASYVTLNENCYPPEVTWIGEAPSEVGPDLDAIKARLTAAEAEAKALNDGRAKLELATEQLTTAAKAYLTAKGALDAFVSPDAQKILDLTEAKDAATLNLNAARGEIVLAQREIDERVAAFDGASRLWAMGKSRVDDSTAVIAACKKDLGSLAFNNGLVKKLRAIRPVIANKVWSTVLSSVSVMFSQMRNESSVVTKEASGFLVNGQSVKSLSGSTLDLLGLALRATLTKTFIPNCRVLILDEPCASMDSSRAEALLGFIGSAGFQQCLLITHEEISSSIADNIIEL